MKKHLFRTRIDIPQEAREKLIGILNQQLADTLDLRTQVKQAHWNVKGPHFIALHELFDDLAESLDEPIDDVAERVTALGGLAHGTARMAANISRLAELPEEATDGMELVSALSDRFAQLGASVRKAIDETDELGDADTADLLTGLSRDLDKHLWFLEAHLQK